MSNDPGQLVTNRARRYDSPQGTRLNVCAIEADYGINRFTFNYRQKHGWPGGKDPLKAEMMPGAMGPEATFLQSEIESALLPSPPFDGRYQTSLGARLNRAALKTKLKVFFGRLNPVTLWKWESACPFLDGEPLIPIPMKSPATGKNENTYSEQDIDTIQQTLSAIADASAKGRY